MQVTVEISYYPLHQHYGDEVLSFLSLLKKHDDDLMIKTNHMSTQITGPFTRVMECLKLTLEESFQSGVKASVVMKMFNDGLELDWLDIKV